MVCSLPIKHPDFLPLELMHSANRIKLHCMKLRMLSSALIFIAGIASLIAPAFGLSDTTKSGRARATCVVPAGNSTAVDDVPAILDALTTCGNGGRVSFSNTTYHINSVMNTTWLDDVEIDLQGTLLVGHFAPYPRASLNYPHSGAQTSATGSPIP